MRSILICSVALAACAAEPSLSTDLQAELSDATTGGTPGFYFLPPLVPLPTYSGTFDPNLGSLLDIWLYEVDCTNSGMVGSAAHRWTTVYLSTAQQQYRVTAHVGTDSGVSIGHCYRVIPRLDGVDLGFRDVAVISGSAPAPDGYRKWGWGANQTIAFRLEDMDPDDDGLFNTVDNCPFVANPGQEDADGNGVGDACEGTDTDGDGVPDPLDVCPTVPDPEQIDSDHDGFGDACEACPGDPNKTEPGVCGCGISDVDQDGDGLICDDPCPLDPTNDVDGDGICGGVDVCPFDPANDADSDGVCGDVDNCPGEPNPDQADGDGDGIGDACDALCLAGVIGQWTGDDTAEDSRGTADGVWSGTAAYAPAVVGHGFSFDTTSSVGAAFARDAPWSVSMWVRASFVQPKNTGLLASSAAAQLDTFQIDWGADGIFRVKAGKDALNVAIGAATPGTFQHVGVTYAAGTIKTYLDGALVSTAVWSGPALRFTSLRIGANRGSTLRFAGIIDDVAVFDRMLSTSEVSAIHDVGRYGLCP
jgi:hypothetical protein